MLELILWVLALSIVAGLVGGLLYAGLIKLIDLSMNFDLRQRLERIRKRSREE